MWSKLTKGLGMKSKGGSECFKGATGKGDL